MGGRAGGVGGGRGEELFQASEQDDAAAFLFGERGKRAKKRRTSGIRQMRSRCDGHQKKKKKKKDGGGGVRSPGSPTSGSASSPASQGSCVRRGKGGEGEIERGVRRDCLLVVGTTTVRIVSTMLCQGRTPSSPFSSAPSIVTSITPSAPPPPKCRKAVIEAARAIPTFSTSPGAGR